MEQVKTRTQYPWKSLVNVGDIFQVTDEKGKKYIRQLLAYHNKKAGCKKFTFKRDDAGNVFVERLI